ncbi:transmembrane protein 171-like [Spea bombifrons]|uniref:transmembrane protein 171-like n=1 Tax=Spea bombifrons TaxID=233779 RepID=UPI002349254C|nr:transmembrane protein 171-like [Spea bombifrons]
MERTCFGTPGPRTSSSITFTLFVFGWALLCGGSLLSVYGFATCQSDSCITYKVTGPVLAGLGLACLMMAEFTAKRDRRRRELEGDPTDPDSSFLCGKSRQFVQFVILGMLLLACVVLICIPGLVFPACKPVSNTDKPPKVCETPFLQAIVIILIVLCYCLAICLSKGRRDGDSEEDPEACRYQPLPVRVGDEVFAFPSVPPPHFAGGHDRPMSRDPPSYDSILFERGDRDSGGRDGENVHTVPWRWGPRVEFINEPTPSEPPPRYEDIYPSQPDPEESSSSSSSSYYSVSQSSESSDYELAPGP